MPRRSSRLQNSTSNSTESTVSDNVHVETSMESSQLKKRRKVTNTTEKKVRRNPKKIPDIPMDILLEIFKELEPNDLLQMARTSKNLRQILMSRSAAHTWRAAFMNVPRAPKCFEGVSEPQFASLLYEKICHLCGSRRAVYTVIGLHFKACTSCVSKYFISEKHIHLGPERLGITQYNDDRMRQAATCTPYVSTAPRSVRHYHKDSMISIHNTLESFGQDFQRRLDWLDKKEKEAQKWNTYTNAYKQWDKYQEEIYKAACEARAEEIIKRLINEGYDREIKEGNISRLLEHPFVKQNVTLTEKIWLGIKPTLIGILEGIRTGLALAERKKVTRQGHKLLPEIMRNYALQFPPNTVLPPAADLYTYESFSSVIDNAPLFEELTIDRFKDAIEQLPEICQDWKLKKDLELLRMLPKVANADEQDTSRLLLATSIFGSGGSYYGSIFFYPNVLMHEDACIKRYCDKSSQHIELILNLGSTPWNMLNQIKFHQKAYDIAAEIVLLCGLDPRTTTTSQMDEEKTVLECLGCNIHHPRRRFMTWRTAVSHGVYCSTYNFAVLRGAEVSGIRMMLDGEYRAVTLESSALGCSHCRKRGTYAELKKHIVTCHDKPELDSKDIFVDMRVEDNYTSLKKLEVFLYLDVFQSSFY